MWKKQKNPQQEAQEIIEAAERKARHIVERAIKDAQDLISNSQILGETLTNQSNLALKQISENFIISLEEQAQKMTELFKQTLNEIYQKSVKRIENEINGKQVKEEVVAYKQQAMKNIEEKVKLRVQQLAKEILKMSLTDHDHEELLFEALQKARDDGFFNL